MRYYSPAAVCGSRCVSAAPQLKSPTLQVSFTSSRPFGISYVRSIKKIEAGAKKFGVKPFLFFDGTEKNLIMAQKVQKCLNILQEKKLSIPKMEIHLDNWQEAFEGASTAAITEVENYKGKSYIEMSFNTPRYRYLQGDKLHRIKKAPFDTSFEMDFFHEFTHAYQACVNHENFSKLLTECFDSETNKEIAQKISSYAATNKGEFVAEYFAYKMMGKEIKSKKLEILYKQCLGPEVDF